MDRQLELILEDGYLADLESKSVADIRTMRNDCQKIETTLSFLRRLAQGRLDIVQMELTRRQAGGDRYDLAELVEQLPQVLSGHIRGTGASHLPQGFAPGPLSGEFVEELAAMEVEARLSDLPAVDDDWLATTRDSLMAYEQKVSQSRRQLFERIDALQDELGRRYRSGEASVDALIAGS